MRRYIVLGEEGMNVLGVIRSLGESGIHPIAIILRSPKGRWASRSKYVGTYHCVETLEKGLELLVNTYGNEKEKPFVYTTDDSFESLLDNNYERLKDHFIFFNAGAPGRVTYYMNKSNVMQLAVKHGLNVLDYRVVKRGEVLKDIEYPVLTKAVDSTKFGWKSEVHLCQNEAELQAAFDEITSDSVIVQKYLDKKNELCLDGLSVDKGRKVFISIASTYKYKLPTSYSLYMDVFNFDDAELTEKLTGMLSEVGFEGIYSIEFLEGKDGELYFGEINFRNSTWSYASTCAGMDLPVLWAEKMESGAFDAQSMRKQIAPGFTAMSEVGDLESRVSTGNTGLMTWLRDFYHTECKYYVGRHFDYIPPCKIVLNRLPGFYRMMLKRIKGK